MESKGMPGFQVMSDLLTMREKIVIYSLIPPHCTLIKSTVAQVLESTEPMKGHLVWSCVSCGVLCLMKDDSVDSYFLRLFSVKRAELLWEHEVYVPFKYTASRTYFHTFPVDGHQAGFNFADEPEAEEFNFAVETIKSQLDSLSFENTTLRNNAPPKLSAKREKSPEHTERQQQHPTFAPATAATKSALDFFKDTDLDMVVRRLFLQANLTNDDLKNKSVGEIVDLIIQKFGGAQGVQRELNRVSGSSTMPRATTASISLAMKKGPLPRTPSFLGCPTTEQAPHHTNTGGSIRIRKSASFNTAGDMTVPATGQKDAILAALKEVFRKKQIREWEENQDD